MKALILLCVFGVAFAVQECPSNSHYESCGTACPLTCQNFNDPPTFCVLMCVAGCVCDEGYVQSIDGQCVKPEHCPALDTPKCPANSHYESCGTACPLTCENMDNPPEACVLMCNPGCHCDEGYVRSIDGNCVKPQNCPARDPPACGANSHYESCGTACPLTCENYVDPPKACVLMCNPGCHCDEGYVKAVDGNCVKPEYCPARDPQFCEENSHHLACGTACPLTCENYDNPPKICPAMCVSGCHCLEGFVKAKDGRCVKPENCPSDSVTPAVPSCFGEAETGNCRAYVPMYHYDIETGTCKEFIYGGCGGNDNRFASEKDCMDHCEGVHQRSTDICHLPQETGVCRGFFPRFYFDRVLGRCTQFIYGGCGGNENNFDTEEECQQTCEQKSAPLRAFDRADCGKIPETGPCKGDIMRFYYDQKNFMCKPFVYGGCQGNANNFETEAECYNKCGALSSVSACEQEKVVGPCRAYFPRYFFNQETGQCEQFIYGGCHGNDNNFATKEDCHSTCVA